MKRSVRLSLYSVTITALVAASSAIGCGQPAVAQKILDARRPNTTPPKFLLPQSSESASAPNTRSLLLFVHGIFGDTVGTWTRSADDKTLAHIVLSREEFKNGYDAFAFGFPSAIVKLGSFSIPQAATTLATEIEYRQFLKRYKQIVIVTHSMGGLVALEMLTANQDVRARVPLVVSFATPYNGSQASSLGDRLLENPAISDMLPRDSENSFLSSRKLPRPVDS